MTGLALRQVVESALAEVGIEPQLARAPKGRSRLTEWSRGLKGFGVRHYPSGRKVYIAQMRMAGRLRTVTIGPCHIVSRAQAIAVARRVLAHALVGNDPASERIRIRHAPLMDNFLVEYWSKCAPRWKPSTYAHPDPKSSKSHRPRVCEGFMSMKSMKPTSRAGLRGSPTTRVQPRPTAASKYCVLLCARQKAGAIDALIPTPVFQ